MYKTTVEIYLMPDGKLVECVENAPFARTFEEALSELDCCAIQYECILERANDAQLRIVISLFWMDEENQSRLLAHKELSNQNKDKKEGE